MRRCIKFLAHPRWDEFQRRLALVVVTTVDPAPKVDERLEFRCDNDHAQTRRILAEMGGIDIDATLPPIARQEWDRIVAELIKLGVLSKFDRGPLAVYCGAYALWAEAMEALQKYGTMIKSPTGYPVQSPYVAVVNRQADMMMRIVGEFGFTPAARSRSFSYTKSQTMLLEVEPNDGNDESGW